MPQNKPLPLPPRRGQNVISKVRRDTMPKLGRHNYSASLPGLSPTSSEYSQSSSKPSIKSNKRKESPAKYILPTNNNDEANEDIGSDAESDRQTRRQSVRPSLKGLTLRKSPRELLLERRLIILDQQNAELRRQLKIGEVIVTKEKDELIALLHNQNKRFKQQIQHQNGIVARIANKISEAFQEYQDTVGQVDLMDNTESDGTRSNSAESDAHESDGANSNEDNATKTRIKVYSHFSHDSDSEY
ncbi:hypothetical protein F5B17DRAFT_284419 [Nemania serpens]|nr:hypothetical protein F5B17DRAFT_284419 [Nemania serpens]